MIPLLAQTQILRALLEMTIADVASLTVIIGATAAASFWLGSKVFATRKDYHRLHNTLEQLAIRFEAAKTDIAWIKRELGGRDE